MFRAADEGARAKREYLLEKRRHEYAVLSHQVRRMYVGRLARSFAGAVATLGALVMVMCALDTVSYMVLASYIPGPRPAVISTVLFGTWIATVMMYFVARALAEDHYARIISRTVQASEDLYADLERLEHVRPERVAQRLAARVEMPGVLLPLLAVCTLLPLTAAYMLIAMMHQRMFVPVQYEIEMVLHMPHMLPALLLLCVLAALGVRRLRHARDGDALSLGWSRSPGGWIAVAVAFMVAWAGFDMRGETLATGFIVVALVGLYMARGAASVLLTRERALLDRLSRPDDSR